MKNFEEMLVTEDDLNPDDHSDTKHQFSVAEFSAEVLTKTEYIKKLGDDKFFDILTRNENKINGLKFTNKFDVELELLIDDFDNYDEDMPSVAYFHLFAKGTHRGVLKTIESKTGINPLASKIVYYFKDVSLLLAKELNVTPEAVFKINVAFFDDPFYRFVPMKTKEFLENAKLIKGKNVSLKSQQHINIGEVYRIEKGLAYVQDGEGRLFKFDLMALTEYKTNAERFIEDCF